MILQWDVCNGDLQIANVKVATVSLVCSPIFKIDDAIVIFTIRCGRREIRREGIQFARVAILLVRP